MSDGLFRVMFWLMIAAFVGTAVLNVVLIAMGLGDLLS